MHRPDTSAFLKCRVCGALFSQKPDLLRHCQAEGHLQAKNNNKPTRPLTANGAMVAVLRGASAGHLQSQPRGLTHLGTSGSASMGMTVYQQHRTLAAVTQQQVTVVHQETSTVKTTQGLVVLMVIDVSGSMAGSKLEAVKRAIQDLCAALHDKDRVSIITFNNTVTVLVAPASKRKLVAQLSHVLAKLSATGGTAMRDAIGIATQSLRADTKRKNWQKELIVVTDGADTSSSMSHAELLQLVPKPGVAHFHLVFIGVCLETAERAVVDEYCRAAPGHTSLLPSGSSSEAIKESFRTVTRRIQERVHLRLTLTTTKTICP